MLLDEKKDNFHSLDSTVALFHKALIKGILNILLKDPLDHNEEYVDITEKDKC